MKIALIGDIHGDWDSGDNAFFEQSGVGLLLFTGDLAALVGGQTMRIAKVIARLQKPFFIVTGNHDCTTVSSFLGEVARKTVFSTLHAGVIARRYRTLQGILGNALIDYRAVDFGGFTVIGGRPFAMDGERLSFAAPIRRLFGIRSVEDSAKRLSSLVAAAQHPVILLAHNGPAGLGSDQRSPFGVDFRREGGDNGDRDLASAVLANPGKVLMVAAGHMHHKIKGERAYRALTGMLGGTLCVNAARVPRHQGPLGYFIEVDIAGGRPQLAEVWYDRRNGSVADRAGLQIVSAAR